MYNIYNACLGWKLFFCLYIASIHSAQCKYYLDLRYLHPSIQKVASGRVSIPWKKSLEFSMCFWYLFIVYVLAVARKHKFIRQSHQVFQSEFQSELFKNSATTNKIISICLIDKILSTYWKNSSQKRQIVVESSKEFSSKLQMASPIDSDSNWKQKEIDYQCYNFEPTYLPTP